MTSPIGQNLRRWRDARKLTQAQLAERAGISRVAYVNIEAGAVSPRSKTLMRLAEVLDIRLHDLLAPSRSLQQVRFRALKRMTSREQLLLEVGRWLTAYREVEDLLDDRVPYRLAGLSGTLARQPAGKARAHAAAARARDELDLGPEVGIRDVCGLLEERAGVKVCPMRLASDSYFGLSVANDDGGPAVVVNVWERISVERWIFTAAHEFGHLLLHLGAYDVEQTMENKDEEHEADQFASHFLMPDAVFWKEWQEARGLPLVRRVLKVKRIFNVSYRTVLYRLSENQAYGKDIWRTFQRAYLDRHGATLEKTDEPDRLDPDYFYAAMVEPRAADEPKRLVEDDFVDDRLSRLVRRGVEEGIISLGRAAEILEVDLKVMRERAKTWVA